MTYHIFESGLDQFVVRVGDDADRVGSKNPRETISVADGAYAGRVAPF
jgi:hypothetical protein